MNINTTAKVKKGIWAVFKYFTLILGSFISVLPLVSCVITAFKTEEEYIPDYKDHNGKYLSPCLCEPFPPE